VQAGGVDEHELRRRAVHDPADDAGVVCGLLEVIAIFSPDDRVRQRRLAGVGAADEAGEARAEPLRARPRTACRRAAGRDQRLLLRVEVVVGLVGLGSCSSSILEPVAIVSSSAHRSSSLGVRRAVGPFLAADAGQLRRSRRPPRRSRVPRRMRPATTVWMEWRRPTRARRRARCPPSRRREPGIGTLFSSLAIRPPTVSTSSSSTFESEELAQLVHGQPRTDPEPAVGQLGRRRDLLVVLVDDLADDLLEDVLDGGQARGAAELVDHDHDVAAGELHLVAAARRRACESGQNVGGAHERVDVLLDAERRGSRRSASDDVLEVEDAEDVVEVFPDDGDAGEAGAQREAISPGAASCPSITYTISVRGTMTSLTMVSPSSKTEWIIFARRPRSGRTPRRCRRSRGARPRRRTGRRCSRGRGDRVAEQDHHLRDGAEHGREGAHQPEAAQRLGRRCCRPSVRARRPTARTRRPASGDREQQASGHSVGEVLERRRWRPARSR
jgi:hypothetical protein